FIYRRVSPVTQILPRVRPWEPRMIEYWPQDGDTLMIGKEVNYTINQNIKYMESVFEGERLADVGLLHELIAESGYQDYKLAFYDPFAGNLCSTGRFADLPIIVTPGGRTGADLDISLVQKKPRLKPPFNFLAPKSTLISFASPVLQIATPSIGSQSMTQDEQILVRTRESVTIVAPVENVPPAISRIYHNYLRVLGQIPTKPTSCTDTTIHAVISPYSSTTYALIGDKGRVATWSRPPTSSYANIPTEEDNDDILGGNTRNTGLRIPHKILGSYNVTIIKGEDRSEDNADDPWRSCVWGAHPCHLVVASRKSLDLIDFRGRATQTNIFTPRKNEKITAIQENDMFIQTPFQTYIATTHQIACIDQRYTKRPVFSWAHQADRDAPFGIKAMDLNSWDTKYTTVLTWSKRNAEITAYNVSHDSDDLNPITMAGRAQTFPSFQSHTQYINSMSLRSSSMRDRYQAGVDHEPQQAIKPPLIGLSVLPDFLLSVDDNEDEDDNEDAITSTSVSKFSLVQYAYTGAIYAQEIEIKSKEDIEAEGGRVRKDAILTGEYNEKLSTANASMNHLATTIAQDMIANERLDEDEIVDTIIELFEGQVAPWKHGTKELQEQADVVTVSTSELRQNVDLDLTSLLSNLHTYISTDREARINRGLVDIDSKVTEAMTYISNSTTSLSMYEILHKIKCINLPSNERNAIAKSIEQRIQLDPYDITSGGRVIHRTINKAWYITGLKIDSLLRDSEPTVDDIVLYLEDLYPLPESTILMPDQASMNEKSITNQLANLTIPERNQGAGSKASDNDINAEGDVWPTHEIRETRSRTIRRLAQDLYLSNISIVNKFDQDDNNSQATNNYPTFRYLFQTLSPNGLESRAPKLKMPSKCKSVLEEWKIGENPADYKYRLPESAMNDVAGQDSEEEEDEEEARKHDERMLQLRRKREKREEKVRSARMKDIGYNINAGGSLSQPAGVIADPMSYDDFYREADEDGLFSLPTVFSASQPKASMSSRLQSQPKAKPRPVASASQPGGKKSSIGTGRLPSALSLNSKTIQPDEISSSQDPTLVESNTMFETAYTQSQSQSQEVVSLWGASQPVRGTFATKRIPGPKLGGQGVKAKKKKARAQGF
ncbi:hypothetical protein BGZ76_007362, partial [Entomortierella beljakovae]